LLLFYLQNCIFKAKKSKILPLVVHGEKQICTRKANKSKILPLVLQGEQKIRMRKTKKKRQNDRFAVFLEFLPH
jgi:hypothetical protein